MSRPNLFALYREHLKAAKESLARATEMLARGKVRFIHVRETHVRAHTRKEYSRAYYPPQRKS